MVTKQTFFKFTLSSIVLISAQEFVTFLILDNCNSPIDLATYFIILNRQDFQFIFYTVQRKI